MFYRKLGKTDLEVSNLGFGCMRLPHKEHFYEIDEVEAAKMFDYAIEHGNEGSIPKANFLTEISGRNVLKGIELRKSI